jgi:glycine/D-amino acid oxidase-like deaminating enzyme
MPVKSVAVLGGGLLGCSTALALAGRGARVVIYEQDPILMGRASRNNEGKIHLGYVYVGDGSLATARMMIGGRLSFGRFLDQRLALSFDDLNPSGPVAYPVHRDTQRSVGEVAHHFAAVHTLWREAAVGGPGARLGRDPGEPPRLWTAAERDREFDPEVVLAVFDTSEFAIDPFVLAERVRERVAAEPRIEVRLKRKVTAVEDGDRGLYVVNRGEGATSRELYGEVVNALWDGRVGIDATHGAPSRGPWLHRFRYGIRLEPNGKTTQPLRSVTVIHGAFGGVVSYENGALYVNWYPACRLALSDGLAPPDLPLEAEDPLRTQIISRSFDVFRRLMPAVSGFEADCHARASVIGGVIFAVGSSDIDNPTSELHRRDAIGVASAGRYHSVDPGKLTLAPHFAEICAGRIIPP